MVLGGQPQCPALDSTSGVRFLLIHVSHGSCCATGPQTSLGPIRFSPPAGRREADGLRRVKAVMQSTPEMFNSGVPDH